MGRFCLNVVLVIVLPLMGCTGVVEVSNELAVKRDVSGEYQNYEDISFLWQTVSMTDFCQAVLCEQFDEQTDKEVVFRLKGVLQKVVDGLAIKQIPRPELVFVSQENHLRHHLSSYSMNPYDGYVGEDRSYFSQFVRGEFHPISLRPYPEKMEGVDESLFEEGYEDSMGNNILRVTPRGLHSSQSIPEREIEMIHSVNELSASGAQQITGDHMASMFKSIFGDRIHFRYDHTDTAILFSKILREGRIDPSSSFDWRADGIYVERKLNKIVFSGRQSPSEVPWERLLIELMWEIFAYYEVHFGKTSRFFIYPTEVKVPIVTDVDRRRRAGGIKPLEQMSPGDASRVFRTEPFTMKHEHLELSPEIFALLYFLEMHSLHLWNQVGNSLNTGAVFIHSPEAQKFIYKFQQTEIWQDYKVQIEAMKKQATNDKDLSFIQSMLHHRGIFLTMIASRYNEVPVALLEELERLIFQFYSRSSTSLDVYYLSQTSVETALLKFRNKISPLGIITFISKEVSHWLDEKRGGSFRYYMKLFSQILEAHKNSYNRLRANMIDSEGLSLLADVCS